MIMFEYLWLIPLGTIAGVLGSMIGLGGGIVIVPILTFLGFPPTLAASNSLFAAFSNSVASTISYSKQKRIDYNLGLKLGLLCIPGTVLGAFISVDVPSDIFKLLFGAVLIISGIYIFFKKSFSKNATQKPSDYNNNLVVIIAVAAASFFAGIISSFFGIGGGIIFVPLLVAAVGMTMKRAAPTSQFILLFASFSGMITHTLLGHPDLVQSLYLAIGAFAGGLVGSKLSLDIKERSLQLLISIVLFLAALKMIFDSYTIF